MPLDTFCYNITTRTFELFPQQLWEMARFFKEDICSLLL